MFDRVINTSLEMVTVHDNDILKTSTTIPGSRRLKVKNTEQDKPVGIYLLKVNNRNTRTRCEICSKLIIVNVLVSLLLTLNIFHTLF